MKTNIASKIILLFLFSVILFSLSPTQHSDASGFTAYPLDPVIITANRVSSKQSHSAENVIVFTAEEIRNSNARDLTEVLMSIPSIDVQLNGQFGQSTSLSINGSNARQVLLLIDGIPFNTQLSGQANPTQIPINHIKQVEIIKGASSSVWGSSLGGVVNVITKDTGNPLKPAVTLDTSYGEFATFNQSFAVAGAAKQIGYFVSGSYLNTDGPQSISDTEESKLFTKVNIPFGEKTDLTTFFGLNKADTRYALATSSTFSAQPYQTSYGQINLNTKTDLTDLNLALKFNHQDITSDTVNRSTGLVTFSTKSKNFYRGISLLTNTDLDAFGELVIGSDFDWHTLKSNNYLTESKTIGMQAPFANHTFSIKNLQIVSSLRYDHNDEFGSQTSPGLGLIYHFNDTSNTRVRSKISRAFNAPPLLWIYNYDPVFRVGPNPDLKAERSTVAELGLETHLWDKLDLDISVYRAHVKDAIALLYSDNNVYIQDNFRKFRRQGVELLLNYAMTDNVSLYGSAGFNDVKNRETGERVRNFGMTRHKFTFGAKYQMPRGLNVHLYGYYKRWASPASAQSNDRKPIFDLKISKEFQEIVSGVNLETYLNIYNLGNSKYWSNSAFPLPKRYIEGGLSLNF
jgi:vitamin B12 transporter